MTEQRFHRLTDHDPHVAEKRNLVVVRAGDSSLHPRWLEGRGIRNFDIIVSYFGDDPERFRDSEVLRVNQKGGKWDGLYALFASRPALLDRYDFFWLPDDDILADIETINAIFAAMIEYRSELAQPALTFDSHFSFILTLKVQGFRLRYINMVEVMVPIVSASLLRKVLPLFRDTMSGWGLDPVWTRLNSENQFKSAILDAWPVCHTRPIGSALALTMASLSRSQRDERSEMLRRFNLSKVPPVLCYAGIDDSGQIWKNTWLLALRMALNYWSERHNIPHCRQFMRDIRRLLRTHLRERLDLTFLADSESDEVIAAAATDCG